jgi:geranylgeranyl diphosphate synthase type II
LDFYAELKQKVALINEALNDFLPAADVYPPVIHQAMREVVFAGGKRLRPVLVIEAAEIVGGTPKMVLPAACALELIHTYSLVHDDLPAIDNDDFRRGKPTCHKIYGEAVAILVGDALLTQAFALLARNATLTLAPLNKVVQVIVEVSAAAGTEGLIGGQVVDILTTNAPVDAATLEYIHRHKTGALFKTAVKVGAVLAGANDYSLNALTQYAENLGLAFQIQNDILDVTGDMVQLGRPTGGDLKNKKNTYVSYFGLAKAREKASQAAEAALQALTPFKEEADFLRELTKFIVNKS